MRERLFFFIFLLLYTASLWVCTYFPSQDGAVHLYNASVLRLIHQPEFSHFQQYYYLNPHIDANWFSHLFLAGLMSFFSAATSEKLMLSAFLVFFLLTFRHVMAQVDRKMHFLSSLAIPFAFGYLLHLGFYNFIFGLGWAFLFIGLWIKHENKLTPLKIILFLLLMILIFLCHSIVFVMTGIFIGCRILQDGLRPPFSFRSFWQRIYKKIGIFSLICVFPLFWILAFISRKPAPPTFLPLQYSLIKFLQVDPLFSLDQNEKALAILTGIFFFILFVLALRSYRPLEDRVMGFGLAALVSLLFYFFGPDILSGGGLITDRFHLFFFLALILWLSGQTVLLRFKIPIQAISALLLLGFLGLHSKAYLDLRGVYGEFLSVSKAVEPNRTLLPVGFHNWGVTASGKTVWYRSRPYLSASHHISREKTGINFGNYEASTLHFPIRTFEKSDFFKRFGNIETFADLNKGTDIIEDMRSNGVPVDYVLFWKALESARNEPGMAWLFKQLDKNYTLVLQSEPEKLLVLYRRNP